MTILFDREASVLVQSKGDLDLKIEGLRIKFDIEKFFGESMNSGVIDIYNLNPEHRRMLTKRKADFASGPFTTVTLNVGYVGGSSTIFRGNLVQGISTKKGPDWITTLTGYTSFDQHVSSHSGVNDTFENITAVEILNRMFGQSTSIPNPEDLLPEDVAFINLNWGEGIDWDREQFDKLNKLKIIGYATAGRVLRSVAKILRRYGLRVTADDVAIYITKDHPNIVPINPSEADIAPLLSPDTGMLGSPVVTEIGVEVKTLLNPDLRVTKLFRVQSETTKQNDLRNEQIQKFTCIKLTHSGDTHGTAWESAASGVWFPDILFPGTRNAVPASMPQTFN